MNRVALWQPLNIYLSYLTFLLDCPPHNLLHNINWAASIGTNARSHHCNALCWESLQNMSPWCQSSQIVAKLRSLCERFIRRRSRCVRLRAEWHCSFTLSEQRRQWCCESSPWLHFFSFFLFLWRSALISSMSNLLIRSLMALLIGAAKFSLNEKNIYRVVFLTAPPPP